MFSMRCFYFIANKYQNISNTKTNKTLKENTVTDNEIHNGMRKKNKIERQSLSEKKRDF